MSSNKAAVTCIGILSMFDSVLPEVTLSALNAPESDVDIEGLGDGGASKKLDFDSGKMII